MRSYLTVCLLCLFGLGLNAQDSAVQGVEKALNYYHESLLIQEQI